LEAQRLLIERFTTAFEFLDKELLTQSEYLMGQITDAWEYYGGVIPDGKMTDWLALLAENTAKLQEQSGLLTVGSQAWIDNQTAMNSSIYSIGLINGLWEDSAGFLQVMNGDTEVLAASLRELGFSEEQIAEITATANMGFEETYRFLESLGLKGEDLNNVLIA